PQGHAQASDDAGAGAELLRPGHRRHRGVSFRIAEVSPAMTDTFKLSRLVFALAATALLAACSGGPADHAAEATTGSSSAGLPDGRIAEGEQQANVKGKATGQSCIDCHGADGNVPLDPSYPKIGGQFADYLGHALQGYRDGAREHALM